MNLLDLWQNDLLEENAHCSVVYWTADYYNFLKPDEAIIIESYNKDLEAIHWNTYK